MLYMDYTNARGYCFNSTLSNLNLRLWPQWSAAHHWSLRRAKVGCWTQEGFHVCPLFLRGDFQNSQARRPTFTCSHKSHNIWGPGPTRLVGTFAFGVTGTGTASGCYVLLAMLCGFSVLCVVVAVGFMLAVPGRFASILTHYTKTKMKYTLRHTLRDFPREGPQCAPKASSLMIFGVQSPWNYQLDRLWKKNIMFFTLELFWTHIGLQGD